jgi:hypothetical protein
VHYGLITLLSLMPSCRLVAGTSGCQLAKYRSSEIYCYITQNKYIGEKMSKPSDQIRRTEKLLQMTIKVEEALQSSQHPDVKAAAWVMMNFVNTLVFSTDTSTSYNVRLEGNVLTALCFRNGPIEDFHEGLSSLNDIEMKKINIWSSRAMTGVLVLKEIFASLGQDGNEFWQACIIAYHEQFCSNWETTHGIPVSEEE